MILSYNNFLLFISTQLTVGRER